VKMRDFRVQIFK